MQPGTPSWGHAVAAYKRDGGFEKIEARMTVSDENKEAIKRIAAKELAEEAGVQG